MKVFIISLCFLGTVYCQIIRPGNSAGEVGVPEFDEIKVESVLTVRSKSASRTGKSSSAVPNYAQNNSDTSEVKISRNTRSPDLRQGIIIDRTAELAQTDLNKEMLGESAQIGLRKRRYIRPKNEKKHSASTTI